jgi:hypothetical protein
MRLACRCCGRRCDTPMLKDELWAVVSPREEYEAFVLEETRAGRGSGHGGRVPDLLCLECVERRLGRTVYCEDLNNSLWSQIMRAMVEREVARALGGRDGAQARGA